MSAEPIPETTPDPVADPRPRLFDPATPSSAPPPTAPRAPWRQHLVDAEGGVKQAVRGDSVFCVQLFAAAAVLVLGVTLGLGAAEWALLVVAGAAWTAVELVRQLVRVFAEKLAETDRSAARRVDRLATAAAAACLAGAGIATALIFGERLWRLFGPGG